MLIRCAHKIRSLFTRGSAVTEATSMEWSCQSRMADLMNTESFRRLLRNVQQDHGLHPKQPRIFCGTKRGEMYVLNFTLYSQYLYRYEESGTRTYHQVGPPTHISDAPEIVGQIGETNNE